MTYEITIPNWYPVSSNERDSYTYRGKSGRAQLRRRMRADRDLLYSFVLDGSIPAGSNRRRVSLRLTYPKGAKRHDPDAFWKCLLDCMVQAGWLVDDSSDWLERGTEEYVEGEQKATTIIVEDLESED